MFTSEPELPTVADEDKTVVRNVLYAIRACISEENEVANWAVVLNDKGYTVNVYFGQSGNINISLRDLQTIQDVSPLRLTSINIVQGQGKTPSIKASIMNKDQPIMLTETDVVRVRKRLKLWSA